MFEPAHFNVRADECSTAVTERGHRVVLYRGESYVMVGFYFARHERQRELYYILCPPSGDSAAGASDVCRRRNHQETVTLG